MNSRKDRRSQADQRGHRSSVPRRARSNTGLAKRIAIGRLPRRAAAGPHRQGEAGADPLLAAVLIGLGVNSLSMASNSIAEVKGFIASLTLKKCQEVAQQIVKTTSATEAKDLAKNLFS